MRLFKELLIIIFILTEFTSAKTNGNDSSLQSQTKKGTISLSGSISYSNTKIKYDYSYLGSSRTQDFSYDQIMLNPSMDFFIIDNFSLGFVLSYQRISGDVNTSDQLGVGPIFHYYIGSQASKPFVYLDLLVSTSSTEISSVNSVSSSTSSSSYSLGLGFGYNIALSKNIALQPAIIYQLLDPEHGSFGDVKTLLISIGVNNFLF